MRLLPRLLPREEKFFVLFQNHVNIISEASRLLLEGVQNGNAHLAEMAGRIKRLEHDGDAVIHEIFVKLNQTFITPLDPEDIHQLSSRLDDVLDGIEDTAYRLVAYRLEPIPPTAIELCQIVHNCVASLLKAFEALSREEALLDYCIEVNRWEDEADKVLRRAVAGLFEEEKDPIALIKLKEVYEFLEETTDRCEDVADVLQNVVVKNS